MDKKYEQFDLSRLNNLDIVAVAQRLGINPRRSGTHYLMRCPWHKDTHPSLVLYNHSGNMHCHCYSCCAHHSVIDLVMALEDWTFQEACQWLSTEFGIGTLPSGTYVPKPKRKPVENYKEPKYTYIPMPMVDELVSVRNSLCRCLMRMGNFLPEQIDWLTEEYRLGCYALNEDEEWTAFPCIDGSGRVYNLKVQLYDTNPQSPRFGHSVGDSYWLGKIWKEDGRFPKNAVFHSACMFGEHLLTENPNSQVALVESPKNVLFGALFDPSMTWVAVGNKGMLKRSVLKPLQGRDVLVIPDRDAINEWTDALRGMADIANFTVSDFCLRYAPEGDLKFDIADYLQQLWKKK